MGFLKQDIWYAVRGLKTHPGYAIAVAVALALGIGLNTAIFSVVDVLMFRPLLLEDMDRLVQVDFANRNRPTDISSATAKDYYEWCETASSFDRISAFDNWDAALTGAGEPESVRAYRVTWEFFETLGVRPALGRGFREEEDAPGKHRVAVLSHELWERRYAADPGMLGRTIELDGGAFEVIGLAPRQLRYPPPADLWVPLALTPEEREDRNNFWIRQVARLKQGVPLEQGQAEMRAVADRTSRQFPDTHKNLIIRVDPLRMSVSGILTSRYSELLLYAVGFVLLIACLNVASLQIARISGRARELTIRTALGASRWRLLRIVLAESVFLAVAGAALGLVFAQWSVFLIKAGMPPEVEQHLPGWSRMAVDGRALGFTVLVALCAGVASGLIPAVLASRINIQDGLRQSSRGNTASRGRQRLRSILSAAEIVLALVLLVGAGLMVQGFQAGTEISPGLRPAELLTFRVSLPEARFPDGTERREFHRRTLERLESLPGVESVGLVNALPYSGSNWGSTVTLEDRMAEGPSGSIVMANQVVNPDYFVTMRIRFIEGRGFDPSDIEGRPEVAIVNESFARRQFPAGTALGKRLKFGFPDSQEGWVEIVGVVSDVHLNFTDRAVRPTLYRPHRQVPLSRADYALRAAANPAPLATAVRRAVAEVDPQQPVYNLRTMEKLIRDNLLGNLYVASFMSVFGVLALILALMGVYSIMAQSVIERTGEIGVRMALGARSGDVLWMVLRRGLAVTGIGLVLGLVLSVPLAQAVSSLIFGVSPFDPTIYGVVLSLFMATGAAACLIPARRAACTDPAQVLRCE